MANRALGVDPYLATVQQLAWIGVILLIGSVMCGTLAGLSKRATFLIYVFNLCLAPGIAAAALFLIRRRSETRHLIGLDAALAAKTFVVLLLAGLLGMAMASYLMAPRPLPESTPILLAVWSAVIATVFTGLLFVGSMLIPAESQSERDNGFRLRGVRLPAAVARLVRHYSNAVSRTSAQAKISYWPDVLAAGLLVAICVVYSPFNPTNRIPSAIIDYVFATPHFAWWLAFALAYILGTNWLRRVEDRKFTRYKAWLDWAALLVVGIFVLGLFDDSLYLDLGHYMPYVGPALHARHGGIPMVDVFSQYGFLPWVLINAAFDVLPVTFGSAAVLARLVNLAYLFTIVLILFALSRRRLSVMALAIPVLLVGITFHEGLYNMNALPSTTGMRYLVPAVMVLILTAVRSEITLRWLAIPILVIASFWSLETFVFTLAPWLSVPLCQYLRKRNFGEAGRFILIGIVAIIAAHALFAAAIFALTGKWISYLPYFEFFGRFRPDEIRGWALPFNPTFALWVPVWFVFFIVVAVAIYNVLQQQTAADTADRLLPVATFGIASLLYFVGRTAPTTLGLSFLPFAVVMVILAENFLPDFRRFGPIGVAIYFILVGMGSYMVAFGAERFARAPVPEQGNSTVLRHCFSAEGCRFQEVVERIAFRMRALPFDRESTAVQALHPRNNERERVQELVSQLRRFSVGKLRVGILAQLSYGGYLGMSALMETGQWYLWHISSPHNDELSPARAALIVQSAAQTRNGEVLLIANNETLPWLEQEILKAISDHCRLSLLEKGRFHSVFLTEACRTTDTR